MILSDIQAHVAALVSQTWPGLTVIQESKCNFQQTILDKVVGGLNLAVIIRSPKIVDVVSKTAGMPLVNVSMEVHVSQPQTYSGAILADEIFIELVKALSGRELLAGEADRPSYGGSRPIWEISPNSGYDETAEPDGLASYLINLKGLIRIR